MFVDVDPRTYNLDPAQLEAAITPRTRAVMPVSLYGQCADFDAINLIACRRGLPVIEDAAQSFGATYKGRKSSALSLIGATSFFPSKPLGAYGDGGALFTDDDALAKLMREIRLHGQDRRYHHPRLGLTGRLDSIQAAVLLAKLEIFDDEVAARVRLGARYTELLAEAFAGHPSPIQGPFVEPFNTSVYAQYTIEVDNRDIFETRMKALGVPTAVHYPLPLHLQPVFEHLGQPRGPLPGVRGRGASRGQPADAPVPHRGGPGAGGAGGPPVGRLTRAPGHPRHRDHRPRARARASRHRDRLHRDRQPAPHGPRLPPLPVPRSRHRSRRAAGARHHGGVPEGPAPLRRGRRGIGSTSCAVRSS